MKVLHNFMRQCRHFDEKSTNFNEFLQKIQINNARKLLEEGVDRTQRFILYYRGKLSIFQESHIWSY
jgi:hypothetical protein